MPVFDAILHFREAFHTFSAIAIASFLVFAPDRNNRGNQTLQTSSDLGLYLFYC